MQKQLMPLQQTRNMICFMPSHFLSNPAGFTKNSSRQGSSNSCDAFVAYIILVLAIYATSNEKTLDL